MSPEMSSPYLVSADDARERYPVVEGVPILINDEKSLFSTEQFETGATTTVPEVGSWTRWIKQVLPSINVRTSGPRAVSSDWLT